MHCARFYYGIEPPNDLERIMKRSRSLLKSELFMHGEMLPVRSIYLWFKYYLILKILRKGTKTAKLFATERDDIMDHYAPEVVLDTRPNSDAPGLETKTILHFSDPIFEKVVREILLLFSEELLCELKAMGPGILATVGAIVRSLKLSDPAVYLRLFLAVHGVQAPVQGAADMGRANS